MNNLDIKLFIRDVGIRQMDVARQMGVSPEHLSRVLRYHLKPEMRRRILDAVKTLQERREADM